MALRQFASTAVKSMGMRVAPPMLAPFAFRGYSTVMDGIKYMKSHEWAKVEGDTVTVGISDHAQEALGDVVYVELPEAGDSVEANSSFGVVESVKAASDVYSPISGEVVDANSELADKPATVNESPYEAGWMIKVKMTNPSEIDALLDSAGYSKLIEE